MLKIFNLLSFILMVTVNALANILPINGIQTGAVSDAYPNLFTPAGLTFSIWGLIYVLLGGFVLYRLGLFGRSPETPMLRRIDWYFILSSLVNTAWIFSWHYQLIPLSMLLMLFLLGTLIAINLNIRAMEISGKEKWLLRLPFSIYFGWITVATIANVSVLLVSLGWRGWGLSEEGWTMLVLVVGLAIGMTTMRKQRDVAYGLVIFWAYLGILLRHVSAGGFGGKYPGIVWTLGLSMLTIAVLAIVEWRRHPASAAKKQTE